jgi:hypothetical protein
VSYITENASFIIVSRVHSICRNCKFCVHLFLITCFSVFYNVCYNVHIDIFLFVRTKRNIDFDDIVQHNIFLFEYMWNIANQHADGKLVTVIDMKGLGFRQIVSGPTKQLLKRTVKIGSTYYPERTYKTFIINVRVKLTLLSTRNLNQNQKKIGVLNFLSRFKLRISIDINDIFGCRFMV